VQNLPKRLPGQSRCPQKSQRNCKGNHTHSIASISFSGRENPDMLKEKKKDDSLKIEQVSE
jgi:hypothetical protein